MLQDIGRYTIQAFKSWPDSHSGAGREGFHPGQPINGKHEDLILFSRNDDLLPLKLLCQSLSLEH